jgi:Phage integrase family
VGIQALGPEQLVFQTRTGKPLSRRNMLRAVQSAAERAGIEGEVGLHDVRHSFAALALTRLPLTEVSALLGHASVDVTARRPRGVVEGEGQRQQRASAHPFGLAFVRVARARLAPSTFFGAFFPASVNSLDTTGKPTKPGEKNGSSGSGS